LFLLHFFLKLQVSGWSFLNHLWELFWPHFVLILAHKRHLEYFAYHNFLFLFLRGFLFNSVLRLLSAWEPCGCFSCHTPFLIIKKVWILIVQRIIVNGHCAVGGHRIILSDV
jgi:hypothetical protein